MHDGRRLCPTLTALAFAVAASVLFACGATQGETTTAETGEAAASDSEPTTEPGPVTTGMCPGDPPTSTSGSGAPDDPTEDTSELCPEHTQVDACCCFEIGWPTIDVVWGRRDLCQQIVISVDDRWEDTTACPAAIDCALAALLAGTPGTIRWIKQFGFSLEIGELHIVGDGTVFIYDHLEEDLGCSGFVERRKLRNKTFFEGCALEASALDRFACVRSPALYYLEDVIETCDAYLDCPMF